MTRRGRLSWLLAFALGGSLAIAVAAVPANASRSLTLTGSLTWTWRADPARGCAAAGLCGVSGSIEVVPSFDSRAEVDSRFVTIIVRDPGAVARVDASSGSCVDLVPVALDLSPGPHGGPLHIRSGGSDAPPSSGRCAGPTEDDIARSKLPVRRLPGGGYDLSATTSFGAGPFDLTLVSTLRGRRGASARPFGAADSGRETAATTATATATTSVAASARPPAALTRTRPAQLYEFAQAKYRLTRITGSLSTGFHGLAIPLCDPVDACATTGILTYRPTVGHGTLVIDGFRRVAGRVGGASALGDLRSGRISAQMSFAGALPARLTERQIGPGSAVCSQRRSRPDLILNADYVGGQLSLNLPDTLGADSVRTRCPGPSRADILGDRALARARFPLRLVGRKTLTIALRNPGRFEGLSYGGDRRGVLVLTLRRVLLRAGTTRNPNPLPFP